MNLSKKLSTKHVAGRFIRKAVTRSLLLAVVGMVMLALSGCSYSRSQDSGSKAWDAQIDEEYELLVFVDARGLDYTNSTTAIKSLVHQRSRGLEGDVGHAWFLLRGNVDGVPLWAYGGHSGETGRYGPKYIQGVVSLIESGYLDPTPQEREHPRYERNPVKYLWTTLHDGYFERGDGGHIPTTAATITLSAEQFREAWAYIQPDNYRYGEYSLTEHQCCTLVSALASIAGVPLESRVTVPVCKTVSWGGQTITLWEDPSYASITLPTPDVLQKSLRQAIREGKARDVTYLYSKGARAR